MNNQVEGQIDIFNLINTDIEPVRSESFDIKFETFNEHCRHQGMQKSIVEDGPMVGWCSFANGINARCWSDWVPCTKDNCYLIKGSEE